MHNFAAITFGEMSLHFARSMNSQMFAVLSAVPPLQNISPLLRSMSLTTVARITFHPVNVNNFKRPYISDKLGSSYANHCDPPCLL